LHDRVVVRRLEEETRNGGRDRAARSATERNLSRANAGAVRPAANSAGLTATFGALTVKGRRTQVIFGQYGRASRFESRPERELLMLSESEIFGVLKELNDCESGNKRRKAIERERDSILVDDATPARCSPV
jgi:co-chaperonin GroES (HSP10)